MGKTSDVIAHVGANKRSFGIKLLLAVLIVGVVVGILFIIFGGGLSPSSAVNVIHIEDAFVDVNGDGLVDFVTQADVVINTGNNLNLPLSP